MKKFTSKMRKRLLAGTMAVLMLLSLIPIPADMQAATDEYQDFVTITVKDAEDNIVEGATVNFSVNSAPDEVVATGSETTDENGVVKVLPSTSYVAGMTLSATISKEGYIDKVITSVSIASEKYNSDVTIAEKTEIEDVSIDGVKKTYQPNAEWDAVSVVGTVDGDIVTYKLGNSEERDTMPTVTDAGTYEITVTVKRENCMDLVKTVTTVINPATIVGIDIVPNELAYDGTEQELVTLEGSFEDGDTVTWKLNEEEKDSLPTATVVGDYKVKLIVSRDNGNYAFEKEVDVKIGLGNIDFDKLNIKGLEDTYTGDEQNSIIIPEDVDPAYTFLYQKADENGNISDEEAAWSEKIPTVTNAGTYTVWVKVKHDSYETATAPYNVSIAQAKQKVVFNEAIIGDSSNLPIKGIPPFTENNTFDFSAVDVEKRANGIITYSVVCENGGAASIDKNGQLTVTAPGTVTVTATLSGDGNYDVATVSHKLTVIATPKEKGDFVAFEEKPEVDLNYIFGTNSGKLPTLTANVTNAGDNGEIAYSVTNSEQLGVDYDVEQAKVIITDYALLGTALTEAKKDEKDSVDIIVVAKKAATNYYAEDSASYTISVSFMDEPENAYDVTGTKGKIDEIETEWYVDSITVTPKDVSIYKISNTICEPDNFAESVVFSNEGTGVRYVYLCDVSATSDTKGAITSPIAINEKIDTQKPESNTMSVAFSEITLIEEVAANLGFYNPNITIIFSAKDETSNIHHFEWEYQRAEDVSGTNLDKTSGKCYASTDSEGISSATIVLSFSELGHLRGSIKFFAVDNAGNKSDTIVDGKTFVVDDENPECHVEYAGVTEDVSFQQRVDSKEYYNGDVAVTFKIKEVNFYKDKVTVSVLKDGKTTELITPTWSTSENVDEYIGDFTLSGDGEYVITITAKDKSGNKMADYVSETIVIDTIAPVIDFSYAEKEQQAIITVTEKNFRASDMVVAIDSAKDIMDRTVNVNAIQTYVQNKNNWKTSGDVHTLILERGTNMLLSDAIYTLAINYSDLANWPATEVITDAFVIDYSVPTGVSIEYVSNPIEEVLETVTLGFYKPNVEVKFTAYDTYSGVKSFTWGYIQQAGTSNTNKSTDTTEQMAKQVLTAVQDKIDKTKFTATITIASDTAEQWRGALTATATDDKGNVSQKVTDDGYVIIVDTVAPEVTVEYNPADRTIGKKSYYNNAITPTITVKEANFFEKDVVVTVSKNGGTPYAVTPTWTHNGTDEHIGTFKISGDGHYVVNVSYEDKTDNFDKNKSAYSSNEMTIDTTAPVVSVKYQNKEVINTLEDSEKHSRKYYDATQKAVITITEHNFNASEVDFDIIAKDVTGKEVDTDKLISKTEWGVDSTGDVHTITISYTGSANYQFDIAYTDLATNEAKNYEKDYFTVDKVAPKSLKIDYSTSLLETILDKITFGFYDEKVTVTVSANDSTSGVNAFRYSYVKAEDVSSVNAELINQKISSAKIEYTNDGKTATASFVIPKSKLGNKNQFNGTVEFTAIDRAGKKSEDKDNKRLVVDNIAPTATVTFNEPINSEGNIAYYDGAINTTIVITEANFYADDVEVMVSRDGGAASTVTPEWNDNNVDVHTGTFTLNDDGDYVVTINYTDKSTNEMVTYTSDQLTIDTEINEIAISINGNNANGQAFPDDVIPEISFNDINFENYEVSLTRTSYGSRNVDVTEKFIGTSVAINEDGGAGSFNSFEKIAENDGIYTLTVSMTDKAGHSTENTITFTVNRFGSVYEYDEYLVGLIENGGAYVGEVTDDLVITEYNADRLVAETLNIEITRDGRPLDEVIYEVSPVINDQVTVGESGWFEYEYTISKDNFASDGIYKVSISSTDATGNTPENGNYDDKNIVFRVDNTVPEITSVTGLENSAVEADELRITYTVYDTIGLKSVKVFVNGELSGEEITDFGEDLNNYNGSFVISGDDRAQTVQIIVEDLAGNITDTDAEDFESAYVFNRSVTVTTNQFAVAMAKVKNFVADNTPLVVGGVVVVAGAGAGSVLVLRRRKLKVK